MKRDIRELFKNKFEEQAEGLPKSHREEFVKKLKHNPSNKFYLSQGLVLKIAAVFVIALITGFYMTDKFEVDDESSLLVEQIEAVEVEYLENINAEWIKFVALTDDNNLIKRYKKKLTELDNDYQEISEAFKADSSNILVVELLIENLQVRLELLKDIQEHIKILNQKSRTL